MGKSRKGKSKKGKSRKKEDPFLKTAKTAVHASVALQVANTALIGIKS